MEVGELDAPVQPLAGVEAGRPLLPDVLPLLEVEEPDLRHHLYRHRVIPGVVDLYIVG